MIDVHYHLLYGLDDGPKTIQGSLELARASIAEGVTHIVATPHANERYPFQPELNREQLAELREQLGDEIKLGLGCDFHLSYENLEDLARDPGKYTINGNQYLLVEFPNYGISGNTSTHFFEMQIAGLVPILTHPERNPTLLGDMGQMAEWISRGCLVQLTAASLTGRFGARAQAESIELLRRNWVHLIASDAHNLDRRPPHMASAYDFLNTEFGEELARRLCVDNPRAIFNGEPLPPQPPPIFEERRRGILSRLFGRSAATRL